MLASIPPPLPAAFMKVVSVVYGAIWFIVALFVKLCYSTALFATLAEITRRINVFRNTRRPTVRALLLLPVVILFCSAVLFLLNIVRLFGGGFSLSPIFVISLFFRIVLTFVGLAIGAGLGFLIAPRIPVGFDRFGGLLVHNRGRYLAFWLGTFTICGLFRLLPWGFVTYWSIWFLLVGASLVTVVHWSLYGRCRNLKTAPSPGLPPGEPLDLTLKPPEAVVLALLVRQKHALPAQALSVEARSEDAAVLAHPAWHLEALRCAEDSSAVEEALGSLAEKGLAIRGPQGWAPSGQALRLSALGHVEEALGLTVKEGGAARTFVLQRQGPSSLLVEPGPEALTIRELPRGEPPAGSLATAAGIVSET